MYKKDIIHIRDSIHGSIAISPREIKLIDQPAFQRLRNIKQLGFADLAFPGATHTRYSHSLGAMHLATRIFDQLFIHSDLPLATLQQFRQTVRLAMLFHDIGHAPLSHTTEMLMPDNMTHEDYTLKFILESSLSEHIKKHFADDGVEPEHIAALIDDKAPFQFTYNQIDYTPVLRQIVSSECDADRMDYLQRDSVYCGVNYGKFDSEWLINNLVPVEQDQHVFMGIHRRAIFSFEDFLLSRYHMFASVYLHHTPVIFEKMLEKHFQELDGNFKLPSDIEEYAKFDDVELWHRLRQSDNEWAQRVVKRKPYYLVDESSTEQADLLKRLQAQGIKTLSSRSKSVLSKYFGQGKIPMFVLTNAQHILPLEQCTPLYERYNNAAEFFRIFVAPEQRQLANEVLGV